MEYLIYGAFGLIGPVLVIFLFFYTLINISNLKHKVRKLTDQVNLLKSGDLKTENKVGEGEAIKTPASIASAYTEHPPQQFNHVATPPETFDEPSEIEKWFKENLILKIGVLMVLVGFGWFVSYAFIHDWIGPVGRIGLGLLAGAIVTVFGTRRLGKNELQGNVLSVIGTALVIITLLAGQYFYAFFTPLLTLFLIFLVSVYTSLTAMAYSNQKLAMYGTMISFLSPFFSHITAVEHNLVNLSFYLFVVSLGMIWVSAVKKWPNVTAIGITGVLLYSFSQFVGMRLSLFDLRYLILLINYATSLLYLGISLWGLVKNQENAGKHDVYITVVNTIIILGLTLHIVPTVYQSLVIAAWMFVYAFSGFYVFTKTKSEKLFFIHALISVLFLGIATSIEFSGHTLVIAFAIEAAIISIASYIVTNNTKISEGFFVFMILPAILSLPSLYSAKWTQGILHSDFATLAIVGAVLGVLGFFYKSLEYGQKKEDTLVASHPAFIFSSLYFYAIIWLSTHYIFMGQQDGAVFVSLFIYTVAGLFCYFSGISKQSAILKGYGTVVLLSVTVRLILVDVWRMGLPLRVVTFIVLGVLFISTAFISKKNKVTEINFTA